MAARTGAEVPIVVANAAVFEVGQSAVAGALTYWNSFNDPLNSTVLTSNPIGSGNVQQGQDTQIGSDSPNPNGSFDLTYGSANNKLIAQFFGTASAGNLVQTGCYEHSVLFHETANNWWNTIGIGKTSTNVTEYASTATRNLTFASTTFPGPVTVTYDGIANKRCITGGALSSAALSAATCANEKRVIAKTSDYFLLNAQAGAALATTDKVAITAFNISYAKPQEHVYEIRGATGNSQPKQTGNPPLAVNLSITLRSMEDYTYLTAQQAGTQYKAMLWIAGDTIATPTVYHYKFLFPCLKILEDPGQAISGAGENEMTVTFQSIMTPLGANPTGMMSPYPYVLILNTSATALSAAG